MLPALWNRRRNIANSNSLSVHLFVTLYHITHITHNKQSITNSTTNPSTLPHNPSQTTVHPPPHNPSQITVHPPPHNPSQTTAYLPPAARRTAATSRTRCGLRECVRTHCTAAEERHSSRRCWTGRSGGARWSVCLDISVCLVVLLLAYVCIFVHAAENRGCRDQHIDYLHSLHNFWIVDRVNEYVNGNTRKFEVHSFV